MKKSQLPSLILFIIPMVLHAAPQWQLESKENRLSFTATQNDAPVTGEFKQFTANIEFDPQAVANCKLDVVVDITSVNASYSELKTTLISADWFNAAKFPKAEFKASECVKADKGYKATGTLTIRDKTVPVTLQFTADFSNPQKALVAGNTTIKRTSFGVGQGDWSSTVAVKDDVLIRFKLVADRK